jgi:hypothetical protein
MNESERMKCPDCGSELDRNNVCSNCGMIVASHEQEIEIEYKEFPKSEFLEIRQKPRSETEHAEMQAAKDFNREKTPPKTAGFKSAPKKQSQSIKQEPMKTGRDINKRSLLVFLAGILTAGILAGVYYLLKVFF